MQNSMVVFTFPVLDQKNLFSESSIQKIKIVSLNCILVPKLIRISEVNGGVHVFIRLETHVLCKFGSKHQNCQFRQHFRT